MNSKTAFTCSGCPSSTVSSVTCGWPTGLHAQLAHALVEALGQQAVDHFLANLGGKTPRITDSGTLPGRKPGIFAYF